jgi:hypothetical protein
MPDIVKSYSYLSTDDIKIFRIVKEESNIYYKMIYGKWNYLRHGELNFSLINAHT